MLGIWTGIVTSHRKVIDFVVCREIVRLGVGHDKVKLLDLPLCFSLLHLGGMHICQ